MLALFAALAVAIVPVPESAARTGTISVRPHIGLKSQVRGPSSAALPCLVVPWALTGYYLALGPTLALRLQEHTTCYSVRWTCSCWAGPRRSRAVS